VLDGLEVDAGLADDSVAAGLDSDAGLGAVDGLASTAGAAPESAAGFSADVDVPLGA
jgi:hypothetical protein